MFCYRRCDFREKKKKKNWICLCKRIGLCQKSVDLHKSINGYKVISKSPAKSTMRRWRNNPEWQPKIRRASLESANICLHGFKLAETLIKQIICGQDTTKGSCFLLRKKKKTHIGANPNLKLQKREHWHLTSAGAKCFVGWLNYYWPAWNEDTVLHSV